MSNATLDKLTWLLIYGGLLVVSLGLFVQRTSAGLGWTLIVAGAAGTAGGVLLVWRRSRRDP